LLENSFVAGYTASGFWLPETDTTTSTTSNQNRANPATTNQQPASNQQPVTSNQNRLKQKKDS
jgi:hypothetical protein